MGHRPGGPCPPARAGRRRRSPTRGDGHRGLCRGPRRSSPSCSCSARVPTARRSTWCDGRAAWPVTFGSSCSCRPPTRGRSWTCSRPAPTPSCPGPPTWPSWSTPSTTPAPGRRYLAPALLTAMFTSPRVPLTPTAARCGRLTEREHAVLRLVAGGRTNREVADSLCIGAETVNTYLSSIYAKALGEPAPGGGGGRHPAGPALSLRPRAGAALRPRTRLGGTRVPCREHAHQPPARRRPDGDRPGAGGGRLVPPLVPLGPPARSSYELFDLVDRLELLSDGTARVAMAVGSSCRWLRPARRPPSCSVGAP